jgi:alpha-mannosidase
MEPSPDTAAAIIYADTHMSDTHVVHSTLPIFIKDVRKQIAGLILPVHSGELRACKRSPLLPGVLSTRIWIKQRNHASEILLVKWAEPFSTFASHLIKDQRNFKGESPSPIQLEPASLIRDTADILRHAWRILMENHPHDSICGCSIDQVHDEMRPRFDQVDQIGGEITRQSLQTIADRVNIHFEAAVIPSEDLHGDVSAVVVFNPGGMTYTGPVDVSVDLPNGASDIEIFDSTGEVLPHKSDSVEQRELINMILDRKGMREGLSMVHDGLIAGMMAQEIALEKAGERVTFRMVLSETGAPNMEAWAEGMELGRAYLEDPEIKSFHVLANSVLSPQVRFIATEVPPHGWNTFWVRALETQEEKPAEVHPLVKPILPMAIRLAGTRLGGWVTKVFSPKGGEVPPFVIINEFFRVEANEDDGALTIQDLRTGLVYQGHNRFVDGGDAGDEYNYSPPLADSTITAEVDSVRVYHHPVEEILEISYRMDVPAGLAPDRKGRTKETVSLPIRSNVRLYPGVARIDITTEVDNLAKDHRLRVHFPAPFPADQADYDGHFEVVRRPVGIPQRGDDWVEDPRPEMPQRAFVDISDGEAGLMVANRGLPEVEIMQNADGLGEIALTLLRCVEWLSRDDLRTRDGHAGPGLYTPGAQMPGKSRFEYSIIPHSGYWDAAHSLALNFQTPFRAVNTRIHDGVIPPKGSFLNVSHGAFAISAVKKTEDGRGILVRGYNQTSVPIDVRLDLWVPFRKAELVNLAEERLRKLKPARDGTVSFPVSGNQIVSVVFRS